MTAPAKGKGKGMRLAGLAHRAISQDTQLSLSILLADDKDSPGLNQRIVDALSEKGGLSAFTNEVLADIAQHFAAATAYLCLHCPEDGALRLEVLWGRETVRGEGFSDRSPCACPSRTVKTGCLWEKLVRLRSPLLVPNASEDRRVPFRELLSADAAKCLLLVPLASGKEVLGLIGIMISDVNAGAPEKIEIPQHLLQPAVQAVKLARHIDNARRSGVLQERSRIARDLHDTLAKDLTGVLMHMELAREAPYPERQERLRHILRAQELVREALTEARRIVFAICPQTKAKQSLGKALQQLVAEFTCDSKLQITLTFRGAVPTLLSGMESQLLHITQEALTNTLRHAHAAGVWIELISDPCSVELNITDDGRGFDSRDFQGAQGFGLTGMEERARQIGGSLAVRSRPGAGTQIQVTVPRKMKQAVVRKSA